jgi:hypothetical protein
VANAVEEEVAAILASGEDIDGVFIVWSVLALYGVQCDMMHSCIGLM